MQEKVRANLFDSVERLLRYLIPGIAAYLLFSLSYPKFINENLSKISGSEIILFLSILTIGITVYVIHSLLIRITLELIAYWCNLSPVNIFSNNRCICNYSNSHAKLILKRENSKTYPIGYYHYLWATLHYAFIISELLLIVAYFHEKLTWAASNSSCLKIVGAIILLLCIVTYFCFQSLEKNTIANDISNQTALEKRKNKKAPND